MRAPVSIVIPTLNAAAELPGALASLREARQAGLIHEVVISDGGSQDGVAALAAAAGARLITGGPGRGPQLARGAAAAQGAWLLFLHADSHLAPGWSHAVAAHLRDRPEAAGYFRLEFRARGIAPRLVAAWANGRARWLGLPYGDQGLLIGRALYDRVGGYPEIALMEDVAIARALKRRLAPLRATVSTSAARYRAEGWLRRGRRNLTVLVRYLLGADPDHLAKIYSRPGRPGFSVEKYPRQRPRDAAGGANKKP